MSTITPKDEIRAALHRLRERDGYPAVEALLAKVGTASVNSVSEEAYEEVMAACPPLPIGEGIVVAAVGNKPSTAQALNDMGRAFNEKNRDAKPAEDIAGDMQTVLNGPGGFDAAAKAMNARGGLKTAKAK